MKKRINPLGNITSAGNTAGLKYTQPTLPGLDLPEISPKIPEVTDVADTHEADENALIDAVDKLFIMEQDWTGTHPEMLKCGSDKFYARFANTVQMLIAGGVKLPDDVPREIYKELGFVSAAYLEDFASGFGVWSAFRSLYRKTYGTWLPFFDCSHPEYYEDDINPEDVKFLVWQTLCRCGEWYGIIYSPMSQAVEKIGEMIYDMMVEAVEHAPSAKRVADYIDKMLKSGEYFKVREVAKWLTCFNKLISEPFILEDMYAEAEKTCEKSDITDFSIVYYNLTCSRTWQPYTGPLGCRSSVYLAEMCRQRGLDSVAEKLDGLAVVPFSDFKLLKSEKRHVILQAPDGVEYNVVRNSFGQGMDFRSVKTILTSIVKYGDEWYQNGMCIGSEKIPEVKGELRAMTYNSSRTLDLIRGKIREYGGRKVFYCKDTQAVGEVVGLPYKPKDKDNADSPDNDMPSGPFVVMLSETEGQLMYADYVECFKEKANPYYDKRTAESKSLSLVTECRIPDDVAKYIADHKLLPDVSITASQGKRFGKKIMQDNLRFWMGFYRPENPVSEYEDN